MPRELPPRLLLGALALAAAGCSLVLDFDEVEGHPCTSEDRCLTGYMCVSGICLRQGNGGSDGGSTCGPGRAPDPVTGECIWDCRRAICRTGETCAEGVGCVPVTGGLGQSCTSDADCSLALQSCVEGTASCLCLIPATSPTAGICVAVPAETANCGPCGESAKCLRARFGSGGPAAGPSEHVVCVAPGFGDCEAQSVCDGSVGETVCTWFGFHSSYRPPSSGLLLGLTPACATPPASAVLGLGEPCSADRPLECTSGVCALMAQGQYRCTGPCVSPDQCSGIGTTCLVSPVGFGQGSDGKSLYDVTAACGEGPTLGSDCDAALGSPTCGTDAPTCSTNPFTATDKCTRMCRDAGDCTAPFECTDYGDGTKACL